MTRGSDLPPGVSSSMIPGNDDDPDGAFVEEISDRIAAAAATDPIARTAAALLVELLDSNVTVDAALKLLWTAAAIGFEQGRAEGELDAAARFAPRPDRPDISD